MIFRGGGLRSDDAPFRGLLVYRRNNATNLRLGSYLANEQTGFRLILDPVQAPA